MPVERVAVVKDVDNLVGTIEFDAIVREQHTLSAQATEHAIEGTGQARTDHVLQRPDVIVLECVASNTPVHAPETQDNGTREIQVTGDVAAVADEQKRSSLFGLLNGAPGGDIALRSAFGARVTTKGFDPPFNRRQDVWTELRRMKEAGEIIMVVTSLEVYFDMVIEEISAEATASNGNSLECTITLKRVLLTQSDTVKAPEVPGPQPSRARQNATPDTAQGEERTSAAYKVAVKAGVFK